MSYFLFLLFAVLSPAFAAESQSAVVIVPVADVWSRPLAPGEKPADELRETQVLAGEHVLIHESSGSWTLIEAVEQPTYRQHNRWEGYPGWVRADSIRTDVQTARAIPPNIPILQTAQASIGTPYLWGGLSVKDGLDCSGLTHLSYRNSGKRIPRDAHEQWMKAKTIVQSKDLKPGDLVFSAKAGNPVKITHVALYKGDGMLIEAPQTGMAVREISFKEKFGKDLTDVHNGSTVGDRIVYFGTFLEK